MSLRVIGKSKESRSSVAISRERSSPSIPMPGRISFKARKKGAEIQPSFWNYTLAGQFATAFGIVSSKSLGIQIVPTEPCFIMATIHHLDSFTRGDPGPVLRVINCPRTVEGPFFAKVWGDEPMISRSVLFVCITPIDSISIPSCTAFILTTKPSQLTLLRFFEYDFKRDRRL
jgi:hypothetical protein